MFGLSMRVVEVVKGKQVGITVIADDLDNVIRPYIRQTHIQHVVAKFRFVVTVLFLVSRLQHRVANSPPFSSLASLNSAFALRLVNIRILTRESFFNAAHIFGGIFLFVC